MSVAGSQQRTFLRLLATLRPEWHRDQNLPTRIQALLGRNRAFGSRDRRLYRELIYTTLRHLPWIEPWLDRDPPRAAKIAAWLAADTPATAPLRQELAADWPPVPPSLAARAAFLGESAEALLPAWFRAHCPAAFAPAELDAFSRRAPLWLRLQTDDPAAVLREFAARGWPCATTPVSAHALNISGEPDITQSDAYRRGAVEIQDLGSQLILESARIAPGGRWLDACAGAGGKTLQLARLLGPAGTVHAHDVRSAALAELSARATRAGIDVTEVGRVIPNAPDRPESKRRVKDNPPYPARNAMAAKITILSRTPTGTYDGVLVDAPCSGTGTWRRAPHLKWTTTSETVSAYAVRQFDLLAQLAPRVCPGGRFLYATCSLSHCENEDIVSHFLSSHPDFSSDPAHPPRTLLPATHDTDGFFAATLQRKP
jgi:16S rRNA (cytosine967-C5)-methyltransferase